MNASLNFADVALPLFNELLLVLELRVGYSFELLFL